MMVFIALKPILQIMSHSALGQLARLCDVGFSTQLISIPASWREIR